MYARVQRSFRRIAILEDRVPDDCICTFEAVKDGYLAFPGLQQSGAAVGSHL